ncbi:MAG: cytochrome c [Cytophagales bacterium]|nr:cytochrome c [Cytophagales bacterium]
MIHIKSKLLGISATALMLACASGDNPGREYAPNMYHSVAYEPLSQITDEDAGAWVNSLDSRTGEYFNSNRYNPDRMNMRLPAPNTVKRNKYGWLPYRSRNVSKDSVNFMVKGMTSPLDSNARYVIEGKALYEVYCKHCHGASGTGDGKVADKVAGVANLKGDAYLALSEPHIFHVITYGAGLMGAHGSQVSPEDRWMIARYVKSLQKQK